MKKLLIIGCALFSFGAIAQEKQETVPVKAKSEVVPATQTVEATKVTPEKVMIDRAKMNSKALNARLKEAELSRETATPVSAPVEKSKND